MEECFVTKIRDCVPNDVDHNPKLHTLDGVVIEVFPSNTGDNQRLINFNNCKVKILGDATVYGKKEYTNQEGEAVTKCNVTSVKPFYLKLDQVSKVVAIYNYNTLPTDLTTDILGEYFINLVKALLYASNVSGDIKSLSTLVNLTDLRLDDSNVSGDIKSLSTLVNLTDLRLGGSNVSGDIKSLSTLVNLTKLAVYRTNVSGDILSLRSMTKLTALEIGGTSITGDIKTFADEMAKNNVEHTLSIDVVANGAINTKVTYDGKACAQRSYTFSFKTDGTYTVN